MMEQTSFYQFLIQHLPALGTNLLVHISLSLSATLLAILIGLPLGIWSHQKPSIQKIVLPITNIFQTIPSLALLAFLIPFLGIGFKPTIITLMFYALLPIARNTYAGLHQLPKEIIEAANSLGFTRWQRLRMVELPLALPVIIVGIRTATAMTIGITTIAAFIGAGGLGTFIIEGLALDDSRLILLGAIPTALLALAVDYIIAQFETNLSKQDRKRIRLKKTKISIAILLVGSLASVYSYHITSYFSYSKKNTLVVATKNFSESYILGYLMAEILQEKTKLHVVNKFNLGSTAIIQNALLKGSIDLYPEYTGTAYVAILKKKRIMTPRKTYQFVKSEYRKRFNLIWLPPFGFSNSQTLAVSATFAKKFHLKNLSDLAKISSQLSIAAPAAFIKREDALPALQRAYHFTFKRILEMQPDLVYKAIQKGSISVIEVFTTDARIKAYNLVPLLDNKHIYPPYYAAPVIREAVLKAHPEVWKALAPLAGLIDKKTMQNLNAEVEIKHRRPKVVAHEFLLRRGLLR